METWLIKLFEYQLFEENPALRSVVDSVHRRYAGRELDLNEMNAISAAGMPETMKKEKK